MTGRRWSARFEPGNLVLSRRRHLLWPGRETRSVPLSFVRDIRSVSMIDRARRRARVTVGDHTAPHPTEIYQVEFTPESWRHVDHPTHQRASSRTGPTRPTQWHATVPGGVSRPVAPP